MHTYYAEHDAAVREWMSHTALPVTSTHWNFDRQMLAWTHEGARGCRTLRISRRVVEDTPAPNLVAALDSLDVASKLSATPHEVVLVSEHGRIIARTFSHQ
jgi:hypothetical protein